MESIPNNSARVGECFASGWDEYLELIGRDVLYHREMFAALDKVLSERFGSEDFTLADFGCGDSSAVSPVLKDKRITRYIGVDAGPQLLERANHVLASLNCEKELIAADMRVAIKDIKPVDVVMSSYAMHHLNSKDKARFISDAKTKLRSGGIFVLIDGVVPRGRTREYFLEALEANLRKICPAASDKEIDDHMAHPKLDDFPDSIAFFEEVACQQGWQHFEVVVDKGIFALMVFS